MMWQVEPLEGKKVGKLCGFSQDETSLLVATEDSRYFAMSLTSIGEMPGCDLITAETLKVE